MIPVLTVTQMREIDQNAISNNITIGYSYMLKAGLGLFNAAKDMMSDSRNGEILIFCGKGNNGGDGYVVGRMLLDAGYKVMCYSLCDVEELSRESKIAYDEYVSRKGNILVLSDAEELSNISRYSLIIDAILGTGLKGDPRGLCAMAIEAINSCGVSVLAVDTPSGLNCDTGVTMNPCVRATTTVTMGFPKLGFYFYPGKSNVGKLIIHDLNYPDEIIAANRKTIFFPTPTILRRFLPARKPDGSKIDHGLALLVCGSRGYTGSATLVADAALRTGCGMTHLAAPESVISILSTKLTETVLHPLNETGLGTPAYSALEQIRGLASGKNALCIGPGISHDIQTVSLVRDTLKSVSLPTILDADGINAFKGISEELKNHAGELVITPHRGEWTRLFGELPHEPEAVIETLREKAHEFRMTILLKGNPTIISDPDGVSYISPFGNSALATAGTGDVLSGIIVSLIAQGAPVTQAAILGSYIQGEAGVLASRRLGEYSVIARDVVGNIFRVLRTLTEYPLQIEKEKKQLEIKINQVSDL
jgi:hydroxyethylthiazole kinase-like uncharacterized protein yjeF